MAKNKVVSITVRIKDGVTNSLGKIGSKLKSVAQGFKNFAIAGAAAVGVIATGLTALAKAFAKQETVNKRMKAAFDAAGESGAKAVMQWGAWATTIQRVTTLGDEEIMNLVTLAKVMGVANDQLEEATKGAIGLSEAFGIDLNSSMKMVALATQGEYTLLQRYIPQLRTATDEAEKSRIVHEAMAKGFEMAKDELDTLGGQWEALKGVIGDAMQEAGRAIFGDGGLTDGIRRLKDRIIELTENGAIGKWAEQAKSALQAVVDTVKIITDSSGEVDKGAILGKAGNVIKAAFLDAASGMVKLLTWAAPKIGRAIADSFIKAAKDIGGKSRAAAAELREEGAFKGKFTRWQTAPLVKERVKRNEEIREEREKKEQEAILDDLAMPSSRLQKAVNDFKSSLQDELEKMPQKMPDSKAIPPARMPGGLGFGFDPGRMRRGLPSLQLGEVTDPLGDEKGATGGPSRRKAAIGFGMQYGLSPEELRNFEAPGKSAISAEKSAKGISTIKMGRIPEMVKMVTILEKIEDKVGGIK